MFCYPFSLNLIFLNSAICFKLFRSRCFLKLSFDMNGGKEEAAKVAKSLNYCKEVVGGKCNVSLISPLQETLCHSLLGKVRKHKTKAIQLSGC